MHVTRIHAGHDGESHLEDVDIALSPVDTAPSAARLNASFPLPATRITFAELPPAWFSDWHPAPRRQFWVGMLGIVEVTVSDGKVRLFGPGSVALLDDLAGKGHTTRVVSEHGAQAMLIEL